MGIALRVARLLLEGRDFATASGLLDEAHGFASDRPRDLVLVLAEKAHLEAERHAFDRATALLEQAATLARQEADGALIRKLVEIEANMRRASEAVRWISIPPPRGTP